MKNILSIFIFTIVPLFSLEYGVRAKHVGEVPVTHFTIFSERCSGSNFLNNLVLNNLVIDKQKVGHKHFPPWFELPQEMWHGNEECYTYEGLEHLLVLFIVRNPCDWAQSFHHHPWHAHPKIKHHSFDKFIHVKWKVNPKDKTIQLMAEHNPLVDMDPIKGKNFTNIFKLRTAKIRNMMLIEDRACHFYMINYETVRDYPEEVLQEIAELFELDKNPIYTPVDDYKGDPKQGTYRPAKYPPISKKKLKYIHSQLNQELEALIGY